MIRFEIPRLMHDGSPPQQSVNVELQDVKIPFSGHTADSKTIRREVLLPSMTFHTVVPFSQKDFTDYYFGKRIFIANSWGMSIWGDVDIQTHHNDILIQGIDHFIWPWYDEFFQAHNKVPMRIIAPQRTEFNSWLWVNDQPKSMFNVLPMKNRTIRFDFRPYRHSDRKLVLDGQSNLIQRTLPQKYIFHEAETGK